MNKYSYSGVEARLKAFADAHYIVQRYSVGEDLDFDQTEGSHDGKWPLMHVIHPTIVESYSGKSFQVQLEILFADLPREFEGRTEQQVKVISDLVRIAQDLAASILNGPLIMGDEATIVGDIQIETIGRTRHNSVCAVRQTFTLELPNDFSACDVPASFILPSGGGGNQWPWPFPPTGDWCDKIVYCPVTQYILSQLELKLESVEVDGVTITGDGTPGNPLVAIGDGTGTVTSVDVTADGDAITPTGGPVTDSGTINLGFNGAGTDYIDGEGNLQPFPTIPPPAPVDSVNGQTGVVVLDAGDVGADAAGSAATAESNANAYTDQELLGYVQSVTGLDTDNIDPQNPVVQIAVDGVTITGDGTPGNPLVSAGSSSIALETNGTPNGDQTKLNLAAGSNITLTDNGTGTVTIDADNLLNVLSVTTTNAREEDYSPTGWPGSPSDVKVLRVTPNNVDNVLSISGLTSGAGGRMLTIVNDATDQLLILEHDSSASAAGNRFYFDHQMSYFIMPGRSVVFIHNGTHWHIIGNSEWAGVDIIDHFTSVDQNLTGTVGSTHFAVFNSGTASGIQSSNSVGNTNLGGIRMQTGTTATGNTHIGMTTRGSGTFNISSSPFPCLFIGNIGSFTDPTSAQDYGFWFGFDIGAASFSDRGYFWRVPSFSTFAGVYTIEVIEGTGAVSLSTASTVPTNTGRYLGIFNHGNNGDATFIFSSNGITWNVATRFTRVSGIYGGRPRIRVAGVAGTSTNRDANVRFAGFSMNQKR